jgi:hypothetical protein
MVSAGTISAADAILAGNLAQAPRHRGGRRKGILKTDSAALALFHVRSRFVFFLVLFVNFLIFRAQRQ